MHKTFDRLRLIFLGLFILGTGAAWVYQVLWLQPERECVARGNWWHAKGRTCAVPVDITAITGRPRNAPPVTVTAPPAQGAPAAAQP